MRDGFLQLSALERPLERRCVTPKTRRRHADLFATADDDLLSQVLPQKLERFAQRISGVVSIELRPEQRQQLISWVESALAIGSEESEESDALRLCKDRGQRFSVRASQRQRA